jgi:hypothetical protein
MTLYKIRISGVLLLLMLGAASVAAEAEIHRCLLQDGTIAFQELPCAEPVEGSESSTIDEADEPRTVDDDAFDFVNPFDEPVEQVIADAPEPASGDRAECEKAARDAIDAIDQEMRETTYTREQGKEYLAELLVLTKQLRNCR